MKQNRFRIPYALNFRSARDNENVVLIAMRDAESLTVKVLDHSYSKNTEVIFSYGTLNSLLSNDGSYLIDLLDVDGSELSHVYAFAANSDLKIDLTPNFSNYVVRGLDMPRKGDQVLISLVETEGFSLAVTNISSPESAFRLYTTENEMISGTYSSDGRFCAAETTDHNPGIRRYAISVFDSSNGELLNVLSDGPNGSVRIIGFSRNLGDSRILAYSEKSGFARPLLWNPETNERVDYELADLSGEVIPLDWHPDSGQILAVNIDGGRQRLIEIDCSSLAYRSVTNVKGSFFEPDVSRTFAIAWKSHYLNSGEHRILLSQSDKPLSLIRLDSTGELFETKPLSDDLPPSVRFECHSVVSTDGSPVQFWLGRRQDNASFKGTYIYLHGGPNISVLDQYSPESQAWIDDGWNFVAINYRGSVTAGKAFREGFWGQAGRIEIEDVSAVYAWLLENEIADPQTTFIGGESYGGFLTLMALANCPFSFRAGFAQVAMCDWVTAREGMNPALLKAVCTFLGSTYESDPQRWIDASPLTYVSQIKSQVWLHQGNTDSRTPPAQAKKFVEALRAVGGDVLCDFFSGGHEIGGLREGEELHLRMQMLAEKSLMGQRWDPLENEAIF